jgi:hypothetical protein
MGYTSFTILNSIHLWGYKVEEKLYLGVREGKRLNTTALDGSTNRAELTFCSHDRG